MSATFWDKRSKDYDHNIKIHDTLYGKTIATTKSLLSNSDVVLDFACASGEISCELASHVQRLICIDCSPKMIALANQKALDKELANINFSTDDLFDQSLAINSFSVITAFNIFHLLEEAPKVLFRLNNLLKADGLLISQTPCLGERSWIIRFLISLAQKLGLAPFIRSLTTSELESLISNSSFEIVETTVWDEQNRVQWVVARKL